MRTILPQSNIFDMPVDVNNLSISSKVLGKHEVAIMDVVKGHFEKQGYAVQIHRRLNIAWGNIISDVDVAASKDGKLTVIEVKSKQDNIKRVQKQYDEIKDYIDYYWIATDYMPTIPQAIWRCDDRVGHLLVDTVKKTVKVFARAKLINDPVRVDKMFLIPKLCMIRLCGKSDGDKNSYDKGSLIKFLQDNKCTKEIITDIVACSRDCENNCPIHINYVQHIKRIPRPELLKQPASNQSFLTEYL